MKVEITKMYLEDLSGKGIFSMRLVDKDGEEYAGSVEIHNTIEDVTYIRIAK